MNLKELNSFKLSDAVTFHDKLNPKLWNGTKLRPEVRDQLIKIAEDFLQELGVHDLDVKDITISGSNAAYSYTKYSDLDLHILVDMGNLPVDEVYKELFLAKKTIYNESHDIKIHNIPVELYVQDSREPVVSLGEYSVMNDQWIKIPTKRRSDFDQTATKIKYEKLLSLIEIALKSRKYSKVKHIIDTIKRYRQAGLDKGGEFGPENLAYKMLRSQGYITKLYDLRDKLHSEKLSFETMYQNIDEGFDQPYPITWEKGDSRGDVDALAKLPDGTYLSIMFNKLDNVKPDDKTWMVEFYRNNSQEVTGEGDAQKVFATVLTAIQQFITKYKPLKIYFSASKEPAPLRLSSPAGAKANPESRAKLYDRLVLRYAKSWGYKFFRADNGSDVMYQFSRIPKQKAVSDAQYLMKNIDEGFDQPYPIKWEKDMHGDIDASAKLPDGTYLSIMFNKQDNVKPDDKTWMVEFHRNNSQEVTGEGDAQKVFATVLSAIQQFIVKYKPLKIYFSASKLLDPSINYGPDDVVPNPESRAKLYDRLVQRYAKAWGYRAFRGDTYSSVMYELSRIPKQKAVGEDYTMQYAAEKTPVISPYAGIKDNQYRGSMSESTNNYLWHGSRHENEVLVPRQANDTGGKEESNKNAIYATPSAKVAIAMGLTTPGSDTGMFPNDPQMVLFKGGIRKGQMVYLHKVPKDLFIKHNDREWYSKPDVKEITVPNENIIAVPVDKYLNLIRQATPADLELQKKNMKKQGVAEASGYIPSEKQKNDPRFKTALTVDVRPDSIKKNAKAFYWNTSRAGIPPTAKANGKI